MTKYLGYLHAGDMLKTTEPDGTEIVVTITSISVDPTDQPDGSTMIAMHHEPSGKDGMLTLENLAQWMREAEWVKVDAPAQPVV